MKIFVQSTLHFLRLRAVLHLQSAGSSATPTRKVPLSMPLPEYAAAYRSLCSLSKNNIITMDHPSPYLRVTEAASTLATVNPAFPLLELNNSSSTMDIPRPKAAFSSHDIKFGGRIIYCRTLEEVEGATEKLLDLVEAKKREEVQCALGLDIEWRPTFQRGVPPRKAAVMQICGDNNSCFVFHIIHSQIPQNLQRLLEDPASVKVGVGIAGDVTKVLQDHNVSINNVEDLSYLANQKLGGKPRKWSLLNLTEMLICKKVPKPNKIRLGNWEVKVLSKEQLSYAATDAYVSWYLYQVLKGLPDPPDKSLEPVVAPE